MPASAATAAFNCSLVSAAAWLRMNRSTPIWRRLLCPMTLPSLVVRVVPSPFAVWSRMVVDILRW